MNIEKQKPSDATANPPSNVPTAAGHFVFRKNGNAWVQTGRYTPGAVILYHEAGWPKANEEVAAASSCVTSTSVAVTDVIWERIRQLWGEGYSLKQDDGYLNGELSCAAMTYIEATLHDAADRAVLESGGCNGMTFDLIQIWPWPREFFKPKSIRQDLVRAAALLIAEIERIDRAALSNVKIEEPK